MTRLPEFLRKHAPALILACATAMLVTHFATAQDAPKPAEPAAPAPDAPAPAPAPAAPAAPAPDAPAPAAPAADAAKPNESLTKSVEDFWHYAKIARYDLASEAAKKVIDAGAAPEEVLAAFQMTARDRGDDLTSRLLTWQQVDPMREATTGILKILSEGQNKKRLDAGFIRSQIERLSVNERGYIAGLENLRQAGEVAVPFMVDYLRDTAKRQYQPAIRRALVELGRAALNPLVACTEIKQDQDTLIVILNILGSIGYNDEIPYLARLVNDKDTSPAVKAQAQKAMALIHNGSVDTAAAFEELGERFYYGNAAITYDRKNPNAFVWFWEDGKGLYKEDVSPAIWNDVMSMRSAEYSLKADGSGKTGAVSLWLAGNYKREVDLGDAGLDPIHQGKPSAHFYGTSAGVQYLNQVLDRARKDKNAAVALKAIKSLAEVAGQANLFGGDRSPLIDAMSYPDRVVRFEAAIAVGSALPQKNFAGQEQVVPILAEAMAQTGKVNALILTGSQDAYNKLAEVLKTAGYGSAGGMTVDQALSSVGTLPSVDVIVIDTTNGVDEASAQRMLDMANGNPRLAQLARVILAAGPQASQFSARAIGNPLLTVTKPGDAAALTPVLQNARQRSGSLPLDEKTAQAYSLRAAELLGKLAMSRGQVLNLMDAQNTLLASLEDARVDVAKAGAYVLGLLDSKEPQPALINKAADEKTTDDTLKIAALKGATTNARFFGNRTTAAQVDALKKLAESSTNQDVKNAAAEALGALNLPTDQAKTLIVNQARVQ